MIDPLLSLGFALANPKGAYALLLGSGVSRSAGIPTAWEVVEDLVRKVAALKGAKVPGDPTAWYQAEFGEAPEYVGLLEQLSPSPTQRRELLRPYFEPTADEREAGLKLPTQAHRAIAGLVADGFVRIIVTTNFDRLLEQALADEGITPTVVSNADAIAGMLPLIHEQVVIAKVHGDYMDTRIRNVGDELERFEPALDALLDRVFDEFGLVVCGWSAEWDTALRAALARTKTRRFTTFWALKGPVVPDAQDLITLRRAQVIPIAGADAFFQEVLEKVRSLEEAGRPHPLSASVAVATLKRYLPELVDRIRLRDLVMGEVESLYALIASGALLTGQADTAEDFARRVSQNESAAEVVIALLATGAFWSEEDEQQSLWVRCVERLANPADADAGAGPWPSLRRYPALLALYAAGLGALANRRSNLFGALVLRPRVRVHSEVKRAAEVLHCRSDEIFHDAFARKLPGLEKRKAALSDHLFEVLRTSLRDLVPDEDDYADLFDRFEYFLALAYVGLRLKESPDARIWGPVGRFGWRAERNNFAMFKQVEEEAKIPGAVSWLFDDGLFNVRMERFLEVKREFDKLAYEWMRR